MVSNMISNSLVCDILEYINKNINEKITIDDLTYELNYKGPAVGEKAIIDTLGSISPEYFGDYLDSYILLPIDLQFPLHLFLHKLFQLSIEERYFYLE